MRRPPPSRATIRDPRPTAVGAEWIVGFHAVLAAVEREAARVEVVWVAEGTGGPRARQVLDAARAAGIRFRATPRRRLDEVAGGAAHNGFAARLAPAPFADPSSLFVLGGPACLLGLDGVEDGHNLGAVVRSVAAFDLAGVVVAGPHPPPLGGAAAKVAAGTLPLVRIAHVGSLGDFALAAKDAGFWVYGAEAGGTALDRLDFPERLLLCLGAEAGGLRAKTRKALDGTVSIPIAGEVESLNLSVAAGILAWEWRRRHPRGES
ncbi:MAG TPA: RNA methyltransferase [Thermoanaerobaculaceae bacterium]|nr:RNA methyltransferase [Thermoanaerobaculaceae bacterium]